MVGSIRAVAISKNSRYVASGSDDCNIQLFDLTTFENYITIHDAHASKLIRLAF